MWLSRPRDFRWVSQTAGWLSPALGRCTVHEIDILEALEDFKPKNIKPPTPEERAENALECAYSRYLDYCAEHPDRWRKPEEASPDPSLTGCCEGGKQ